MLTVLHPRANFRAFFELLLILRRHWNLTLEMTRREISDQYAGQLLGVFWVVAHPLFMMGLYVFVFAFVFKVRIGGTHELPLDYTVYLLAGLVPWLSFQAAMNSSCRSLTAQANLVKQVVFPVEILPAKAVFASLVPQVVGLVVLLLYVFAAHGALHATYLLLPFLLVFQLLAMIGIGFALAAISVFFRDTKDFVQVFGVAALYLLPVFYLPAWVPELFKPILYINPFSYMIWCYQDALFYGRFEHPAAWVVFVVGSLLAFTGGYRLFRRTKPFLGHML